MAIFQESDPLLAAYHFMPLLNAHATGVIPIQLRRYSSEGARIYHERIDVALRVLYHNYLLP